MRNQSVLGMLLTAAVCFLVLLLATCNILLALYSMFFVASVLGSVFSIVNFILRWEIGFIESLSIVVIIGFAGM